MPRAVLLFHLGRNTADRDEPLIRRILDPLCSEFHVRIERCARTVRSVGMNDLNSDEALVVCSTLASVPVRPTVLAAFRWACHKRFDFDGKAVQQQVLVDIRGGDETRVRSLRDASRKRRGGKRPK